MSESNSWDGGGSNTQGRQRSFLLRLGCYCHRSQRQSPNGHRRLFIRLFNFSQLDIGQVDGQFELFKELWTTLRGGKRHVAARMGGLVNTQKGMDLSLA